MIAPPNTTYIVILWGKHHHAIGWMRGTWADKVTQIKGWNVAPSQAKVFVNGILPHAFPMRFDRVREATTLEICMAEQKLGAV